MSNVKEHFTNKLVLLSYKDATGNMFWVLVSWKFLCNTKCIETDPYIVLICNLAMEIRRDTTDSQANMFILMFAGENNDFISNTFSRKKDASSTNPLW